jgi:hypothetical protein
MQICQLGLLPYAFYQWQLPFINNLFKLPHKGLQI